METKHNYEFEGVGILFVVGSILLLSVIGFVTVMVMLIEVIQWLW